jgi:lysophospholipase L1-like esterase
MPRVKAEKSRTGFRWRKLFHAVGAGLVALLVFEILSGILVSLIEATPAVEARFVFADVWAHDRNPFHTPDRELFWKMIPGYSAGGLSINRQGFRGPEIDLQKTAGVSRIVFLGDSVTFGFNVSEEETYVRKVLERVNEFSGDEKRNRIEVINTGVAGYTSWQGRRLYETRLARYRPDVVVALFGYNDHHSAVQTDREKYAWRDLALFAHHLSKTGMFRLAQAIHARVTGGSLRQAPVPRVSLDEFEENLLALQGLAKSQGARCLFMTVPIRREIPLVENFRAVSRVIDGRPATVWLRQIDFAMRSLDAQWSSSLRDHFFSSSDLSGFTRDQGVYRDLIRLTQTYPDFPVFHYLLSLCHLSAGDAESALQSMERCRRVDRERHEMEAYNDRLRTMAQNSLIELVDVAAFFQAQSQDQPLLMDVVHPSPQGHALMARLLAERLTARPE